LTATYLESLIVAVEESSMTGQLIASVVPIELEKFPQLQYNQALKAFEVR
jgi:hypothetical protein